MQNRHTLFGSIKNEACKVSKKGAKIGLLGNLLLAIPLCFMKKQDFARMGYHLPILSPDILALLVIGGAAGVTAGTGVGVVLGGTKAVANTAIRRIL
jgi:hypothetical protein